MKFFTSKNVSQKIIIALIILILFNFTVPIQAKAANLFGEIVNLIAKLGDVVMGALNHMMLGTTEIFGSAFLDQDDPNFSNPESYLNAANKTKYDFPVEMPVNYELDALGWDTFNSVGIPNFVYSPENIFANRIAALDVNFIKPHTFTPAEVDSEGNPTEDSGDDETKGKHRGKSSASVIRDVISSWYKAFRSIAIVGLLIVLVYLGIRIIISSTSVDKAKYKESLKDWLMALILVVTIHYIMAGILMFTESVTNMISKANGAIIVKLPPQEVKNHSLDNGFRTNMMGYIRMMAQADEFSDKAVFTIIYLVLVIFTCMFTITYLKRFLYMAFFTIIAPLVALTYPIDKLRDGQAQAFNMWFKEYTMNAIIQPVHLVLYTVLVGSAMDLAVNNPIYACVAIAFLLPAEKFIKKMFGLDKAQTTSGLGEIAGGALAMQGIKMLGNQIKGSKKAKGVSGSDSSGNSNVNSRVRGANSNVQAPFESFEGSSTNNKDEERNNNNQKAFPDLNEDRNQTVDEQLAREKSETDAQSYRESGYSPSEWEANRRNEIFEERARQEEKDKIKQDEKNPEVPLEDMSRMDRIRAKGNGKVGKTMDGIGAVVAGKKRKISNKARNTFNKDGRKKIYKVARRGAVKGAGMALGATAFGTAAMAAGLATGDFSKAMSTAVGGMTLGAGIGGNIGDNAGDKINSEWDESKKTFDSVYHTKAEVKQREQKKYDADWKRDEKNYQYLYKQGMNNDEAKKILESDLTQKYLDAGVTDIETIYKTQKLMKEKQYKDENYGISLAQVASRQGSDYVNDYSAQNAFMENIKKKNGINDDVAKQINRDIVKIKE